MTKSELIERLATQQSHIPAKAVEDAGDRKSVV